VERVVCLQIEASVLVATFGSITDCVALLFIV
jgi:hypothetical protein